MPTLQHSFYQRDDVVQIAKELLGKKLCTHIDGHFTAGKIVETEAYRAPEDPASHAYLLRKTPRTETMFAEAGVAYVYLIYGIYKLFNIVTNVAGIPHAVLIRAIAPTDGMEVMLSRRKLSTISPKISAGPGLLTQALGINLQHNNIALSGKIIWIEDAPIISEENILASPRVGLGKNVFEPYYSVPWRFRIAGNAWTSKAT